MCPASLERGRDGVRLNRVDGAQLPSRRHTLSGVGGGEAGGSARGTRLLGSRPVAPIVAHLREPLYRNGYLLLINVCATSGLGLIFWALAAHAYSAEAVGINS